MSDSILSYLMSLLFCIGYPFVYGVAAALSYVLAGIGSPVSWLKIVLAIVLSSISCFICIALILAVAPCSVLICGEYTSWASAVQQGFLILFLFVPMLISRMLLKFCWWRSVLSALLVPLLFMTVISLIALV
ncbi:MAG: hypothetical protein IKW19_02645 [Akkermansia sp.]|nr:hypothetical protein [Akkermansia sp.]